MSKGALKLDPVVQQQLDRIEPSMHAPEALLYPCSARLKDGTVISCVYFVEPAIFRRLFLHDRPEDMPDMHWFYADQVASIEESPARLPAPFASEIYRAGQSGMGYFVFTVVFSRWSNREYVTGLPDFIDYPRGKGPLSVKSVLPHVGRRISKLVLHLPIHWCIFSREDT
jgi:hypothetical protein